MKWRKYQLLKDCSRSAFQPSRPTRKTALLPSSKYLLWPNKKAQHREHTVRPEDDTESSGSHVYPSRMRWSDWWCQLKRPTFPHIDGEAVGRGERRKDEQTDTQKKRAIWNPRGEGVLSGTGKWKTGQKCQGEKEGQVQAVALNMVSKASLSCGSRSMECAPSGVPGGQGSWQFIYWLSYHLAPWHLYSGKIW